MVEVVRLDRVHELLGFALRRDHVVPPARRHFSGAVEPRQTARNRIGSVKIVQEPTVEPFFFQGTLHGWDGQGHGSSIDGCGAKTDRRNGWNLVTRLRQARRGYNQVA